MSAYGQNRFGFSLLKSGGVVGLQYTVIRFLHKEKTPSPIEFTLSGIVILVNEEHLSKAALPIETILLGRLMLFNEEQLSKAFLPIETILLGKLMLFNEEQFPKAE